MRDVVHRDPLPFTRSLPRWPQRATSKAVQILFRSCSIAIRANYANRRGNQPLLCERTAKDATFFTDVHQSAGILI